MHWILIGGSVMSAWSILRLLGHECAQGRQNLESERLAREAAEAAAPPKISAKPADKTPAAAKPAAH